ncbi:Mobile element protein (plasmid) [Candidatus Enterovibrio altilux]|uniref:Mobile element protein n=1 Tax=Candidatus Enterovibrio altilux TaxID=1927128 RepID=A0A291BAV7_9GAMM|nr:Mobile element protein [Candidatus Enterovibrio luxaltus]
MNNLRYKATNWKQYNQALINSGSLTFWIDEEDIQLWDQTKQNSHGRLRLLSNLTMDSTGF